MISNVDVVLIGYKKVATTLLRNFFEQHPQIDWSRNASYFLLNKKEYQLKSEAYKNDVNKLNNTINIDMNEQISIGTINEKGINKFSIEEKVSLDNFYCSQVLVAKRIKKTLGRVKIIITIREQVDWISSYYLHHLISLNNQDRSFQKFIQTPEGKCVLAAGMYNHTIKIYQDEFGKENVFVLPLEYIKNDLQHSFEKLSHFLNIETINFKLEQKNTNKGIGSLNGKLVSIASKIGLSDNFLKKLKPLYSLIKPFLVKQKNKDILSNCEINMIKSFYSLSNIETEKIIDINLKDIGYNI